MRFVTWTESSKISHNTALLCVVMSLKNIKNSYKKSDQHQYSRNNIHTLSGEMVTRLNHMITKEEMRWSFIKLSQLISKEMFEYQSGEFVLWILGIPWHIWKRCKDAKCHSITETCRIPTQNKLEVSFFCIREICSITFTVNGKNNMQCLVYRGLDNDTC